MTTVSVTYSFAPATLIESAKANQNFQDLVSYINSNAIVKDATTAFTAVPAGPAADPVSDNQFTRKAYVDKQKVIARQRFTTNSSAFTGTVNTDFVLTPTMDVLRLYKLCLHVGWTTSAAVTYVIQFTEDGNVIAECDITDSTRDICDSTIWFEPTAGAHTYRVRVLEVVGGGSITFGATSTSPREFWIEDTGLR